MIDGEIGQASPKEEKNIGKTDRRIVVSKIYIYVESMTSINMSVITEMYSLLQVNMYSGAIFLQQALRVSNLYLSISFLLVMTSLCTVFGGLAAVIYTDTLQFFIMIGGSLYVMVEGELMIP